MNSQKYEKLFDVINYDSDQLIDNFISNLSKEQAYYCLMEAVKCGFRRGVFTLVENELISKSLRVINLPIENNNEPQTESNSNS